MSSVSQRFTHFMSWRFTRVLEIYTLCVAKIYTCHGDSHILCHRNSYGVPTNSRLLKIVGLFCRISSLFQGSLAKETYCLKEPTNRSHLIDVMCVIQRFKHVIEIHACPLCYADSHILCHRDSHVPQRFMDVVYVIEIHRSYVIEIHMCHRDSHILFDRNSHV